MTLEADNIAARRHLRRRLSIWRMLAVAALLVAVLALVLASPGGLGGKNRDHIARIRIEGLITGDEKTLKLLHDLEEATRAKAVLVRIDSPGGTTAGSEAIYAALRRVGEKRPVVAVMDTVAASGGYATAIAADHIVARGNTITGSVGVIFQWARFGGLLDKLGIHMEELKSGKLKAEPGMINPMPEEARVVTEAMIRDSFDWFIGLVTERRKLDAARVREVSDGRVYTGRQALAAGLIDAIGGEDKAVEWLNKEHKIDAGLSIIDWEPKTEFSPDDLVLSVLARGAGLLGFEKFAADTEKLLRSERLSLDGLLALWHPSLDR